MIVKNGAPTLRDTLDSLRAFEDVVVYDNGSTDGSLELLESYPNVRLHKGDFIGFGPTKALAAGYARSDWVFSLDADEVVSPELMKALRDWNTSEDIRRVGVVLRENFLMGKRVTRGGWGNDHLVRLFNRTAYNFDDAPVHEKVALDERAERVQLQGTLSHAAVTDLGQFLDKVNRYSDIRKETSSKTYSPLVIFLRAIFAFFKSYLLKRGFMEGWRGLVIAVSNANGVFWKYMKVYVRNQGK